MRNGRERRGEGRDGYGNDVMKVYEGGTVAAAPAAAEGGEGCKKSAESKSFLIYDTVSAITIFSLSLSLKMCSQSALCSLCSETREENEKFYPWI